MKYVLITILLFCTISLYCSPVSPEKATQVAQNFWNSVYPEKSFQLNSLNTLTQDGLLLGYVINLSPKGFLIISANTDLPAVMAYSSTSSFIISDQDQENIAQTLMTYDLLYKTQNLPNLPAEALQARNAKWEELESRVPPTRIEQWPPAGSTETEGWVKTTWSQGDPYKNMCPIDPVTGIRSLAGCPSIAMGQILVYLQTTNNVSFSDADDYNHNYQGRNFVVDDDYEARGFPNWTQLNDYLQTLSHHFRYSEDLTMQDKAALVWACGAAAEQVYTSAGSGTFGVAQALQAYQKFNFSSAELIGSDNPFIFEEISDNIKAYRALN